MLVALDEGPGPNIKYQYPELTKLHMVVSLLIRCCDVSAKTQSSSQVSYKVENVSERFIIIYRVLKSTGLVLMVFCLEDNRKLKT